MRVSVTIITRSLAMACLLVLLSAGSALGQQQELGDDFIFFVDGTNVLVPSVSGDVVDDPLAPGNTVVQFNYGNWAEVGFDFGGATGADISQNQMDGDTLFLRMLSDPANLGQPGVKLTFFDKNDGQPEGDLRFRANWDIPQWVHDGEWHDLAIPLPPGTWQELEDAKTAGTLDTLAAKWTYGGAWSAGFGVALDGLGPNTAERPDLWTEFEWNAIALLGIHFDNNSSGGPIWMDDVYLGGADVDLGVAAGTPEAMSGVAFDAAAGKNVISWTHNPDFGGYNVYVSESEITDVSADGVSLLTTVPFNADAFSVDHIFEVPHPSLKASALNGTVVSRLTPSADTSVISDSET